MCLNQASKTSQTSTMSFANTTSQSTLPIFTEADDRANQAIENRSLIIIIVLCVIGVILITLCAIFVVRCLSKSRSSNKEPTDNQTVHDEKEVVYNSLYKSVDIKPNNLYQEVDLSSDKHLDSLYAKVDKSK